MMYYSANWQLLEEDVWDDWTEQTPGDIDRHVMYVWGIRYIDDSILRREERDSTAGYDITRYYITDTQFSPVVILDDAAEEIERIAYDAYGKPRHYRTAADIDGDGDANIDDLYSMMGIDHWGLIGAGDVDRSGSVDIDDIYFLQRTYVWGTSLPEGQLSLSTEDNQIGFSGYLYNAETQIYTIRFRNYDAELGRWLERDPRGYVDGSNLYEYVGGMPLRALDPFGQQGDEYEDDTLELLAQELGGYFKDWFWGGDNGRGLSRERQHKSVGAHETDGGWDPLYGFYEAQMQAERDTTKLVHDLGRFYRDVAIVAGTQVIMMYGPGWALKLVRIGGRWVVAGGHWGGKAAGFFRRGMVKIANGVFNYVSFAAIMSYQAWTSPLGQFLAGFIVGERLSPTILWRLPSETPYFTAGKVVGTAVSVTEIAYPLCSESDGDRRPPVM